MQCEWNFAWAICFDANATNNHIFETCFMPYGNDMMACVFSLAVHRQLLGWCSVLRFAFYILPPFVAMVMNAIDFVRLFTIWNIGRVSSYGNVGGDCCSWSFSSFNQQIITKPMKKQCIRWMRKASAMPSTIFTMKHF